MNHNITEIGVNVLGMRRNKNNGTMVWRLKFTDYTEIGNKISLKDLTDVFMGTKAFNQKNVRLADGSINLESSRPIEDLIYIKTHTGYIMANFVYYGKYARYIK